MQISDHLAVKCFLIYEIKANTSYRLEACLVFLLDIAPNIKVIFVLSQQPLAFISLAMPNSMNNVFHFRVRLPIASQKIYYTPLFWMTHLLLPHLHLLLQPHILECRLPFQVGCLNHIQHLRPLKTHLPLTWFLLRCPQFT